MSKFYVFVKDKLYVYIFKILLLKNNTIKTKMEQY